MTIGHLSIVMLTRSWISWLGWRSSPSSRSIWPTTAWAGDCPWTGHSVWTHHGVDWIRRHSVLRWRNVWKYARRGRGSDWRKKWVLIRERIVDTVVLRLRCVVRSIDMSIISSLSLVRASIRHESACFTVSTRRDRDARRCRVSPLNTGWRWHCQGRERVRMLRRRRRWSRRR